MANTHIVENIRKVSFEKTYTVGKDGHKVIILLIEGGESQRVFVKIRLTGEGSSADVIGLVKGKKDDSVVLETLQFHGARQTTSNLLVKSLLRDNASFIYDGAIRVEPKAQKTDAYQRNENLLLSRDAHAESKPKLEILANDVRCTHGATIGSVKDDELWYLATRGIAKTEATDLIAYGFLASVVTKVTDPAAQSQVQSFIGDDV